MILAIGLENEIEGRSLAWALDFPGCFAYGAGDSEALLAVPQAWEKYREWAVRHAPDSWLGGMEDCDVRLAETWTCYSIDSHFDVASEGYEVNAWFRHDWKPLMPKEVEHGLSLLSWSRADLLEVAAGLNAAKLDATYPGERWSIRGILGHVANAEWWYLDRLGLVADLPRADLPKDVFERLECVRARMEEALPGLAGKNQVVGVYGEFWSPRKLLRRAVWHELDHVGHISRLRLLK